MDNVNGFTQMAADVNLNIWVKAFVKHMPHARGGGITWTHPIEMFR